MAAIKPYLFAVEPTPSEPSAETGFALNGLDRLSQRREDANFLQAMTEAPSTRTLVFSGDIPVLKRCGTVHEATFTLAEAAHLGIAREAAFLGVDAAGEALFALLLESVLPEKQQERDDIAMIDLRTIALQGLVAPFMLGRLGEAKSLLYWHSRHRFCANCGTKTQVSVSGWRRHCPACEASHFPRTDPVVIMLVQDGAHCLLGRQAAFPPRMVSCLAGFMESGETIEDAVRREVFEEVGIGVGKVTYFASQPWPFPASLMIGCLAEARSRDLVLDHEELEDARWYSRAEVRQMLEAPLPEGPICPPKLSIANLLLRRWASESLTF
ncbi:NAD(+) diphosphatase [Beijerinckia indica]|uniref:NAD(+) diphosphatase n=1 Tax=Beijerinckia indica subsp. indica (strain ATCC 9039 / DSM 1715 / NCIMB 8712) TaxID=395963 RepID=B2ICM4_BEII9|nr:NAD(+) diphosphatase [Beijerinckia indica]ACB93913.1 NUDIX hydrolase [Beijerinckia indica subsp. indica ATCC 9039]